MKTRSWPLAAPENKERAFRADQVPVPADDENRLAGERLADAIRRGVPVDLEIGCGVGWHPIKTARENPERVLVAIERTSEKFAKFRERLARNATIPNLIPVHADAVAWVTHFAPSAAFDKIFLLYPNPNPKNAQARWVRMPFFGHLLTKLKAGGRIEFRTNIPAYADEIVREATERWGLALATSRMLTAKDVRPEEGRTHFERKYLARGDACFVTEWIFDARDRVSARETLR